MIFDSDTRLVSDPAREERVLWETYFRTFNK